MMRKLIILVSSFLISQSAFSSGFPTVDIASIAQSVEEYILQGKQYATELNMYYTQVDQLYQQYTEYNQKLREYDHMLAQMTSIQQRIKDRDVLSVIRESKEFYKNNPLFGNKVNENDPRFDAAKKGADLLYGERLSSVDIVKMINTGRYDSKTRSLLKAELSALNANDMLSVYQVAQGERLEKTQADLLALRADTRMAANNMGDDSHLATLQLMVEQNQLSMQFQEEILRTQSQSYLENNRLANQINRNRLNEFMWRQQNQPQPLKVDSYSKYKDIYDF